MNQLSLLKMVKTCSVYGCTNRYSASNREVTFHQIPKDANLKETWIKAIRRRGWTPSPTAAVCSDHFKKEDFNHTYASGMARLREGAIPSIFKPGSKGEIVNYKKPRLVSILKDKMLAPSKKQTLSQTTIVDLDSEAQPKSPVREVVSGQCDLPLSPELSSTMIDTNSTIAVMQNSILEENSVPWPSEEQSIALNEDPTLRKASNISCTFSSKQESKCTYETPRVQSLSHWVSRTSMHLKKSRHKIRTLMQTNRRLHKKLDSLKDLLCEVKQQNFMLEEYRSVYNKMSIISKELVDHKLNKKHQYSEELRSFATTLYSLSPSAYLYTRKKLDTALPHPRTLAKWDTISLSKKDPEPAIDLSPDPDKNESVQDYDTSQAIIDLPLLEHDYSNLFSVVLLFECDSNMTP